MTPEEKEQHDRRIAECIAAYHCKAREPPRQYRAKRHNKHRSHSQTQKGKQMPKLSNLFPSKYLKAEDLNGRDRLMTIDRVEIEDVGQDKESKGVVYFRGGQKGLILNQTNARAIAGIAGSEDTDEWAGVQVTLITAMVDFRGSLTNAIRIKPPPKQKPVAAAAPAASPPPVMEPAVSDDGEEFVF